MRPIASLAAERFTDWLDRCLTGSPPPSVVALLFTLSRRELCDCVELTGTSEFSRIGRQWTWSENWDPDRPAFNLPFLSGSPAESRLLFAALIRRELDRYFRVGLRRRRLASLTAIALETGEHEALQVLWQRSERAQSRGAKYP